MLQLDLSILQFTQSIRTAYFNQFIQTPTKLLPYCCCCCFALDDINYARWLSVYLCDMSQLGGTHQCIMPFAMVDLLCTSNDQAHEQCNAMVKGNGGAVGLASDPGALRRWGTAGPQIARLLKSFEHSMTT